MSESTQDPAAPPAAPTLAIADPAPLGLGAFALTTFLLSVHNVAWDGAGSGLSWLGYAIGYGGLCQLLAGMWEFRNKNVFGATAFSSYGGFWIGLGVWGLTVAPHLTPAQAAHDVGWILLAFAIFNTYMLILASQINLAVFGVFLTLELTEIVGFIGNFAVSSGVIKLAGVIGLITAAVAWYTSAAGVANGVGGPLRLPVGNPLIR